MKHPVGRWARRKCAQAKSAQRVALLRRVLAATGAAESRVMRDPPGLFRKTHPCDSGPLFASTDERLAVKAAKAPVLVILED